MTRRGNAGFRTLAATTARQHGLFTVQQAAAAGVSKGVLDRRVRDGELVAVDYSVYRSALTPTGWHQRLLAACLAGPALASHRSAAFLWRLPTEDATLIEVTALRHRRRHSDEVVWHESYLLDESDITEIDGIPVTGAGRTLADLAGVLPSDQLRRAADEVLRRNLASAETLGRLLERLGSKRRGSAALRLLLHDRGRAVVPESDLETQFELLLVSHGLPLPVSQHTVVATHGERYRIDYAYPDIRVGIELLGAEFHALPERWAADIERSGVLAAMGWLMLSFTYHQVTRQSSVVVQAVDRARSR